MTPPKFFAKLAGSGFSFESMARKDIAQITAGRTDAELVDLLRGTHRQPQRPARTGHFSGTTLRATDTEWQHGTGPEVSGPAIALVMAMTGRKAALDDLTGEGVAVLRDRA